MSTHRDRFKARMIVCAARRSGEVIQNYCVLVITNLVPAPYLKWVKQVVEQVHLCARLKITETISYHQTKIINQRNNKLTPN